MFSFKDFDKQSLQEKLVVVNKGKKEGQVIFLAGGAGSGKGFAIDNFIAAESYKVVNPDDLKVLALSLGKKKPDEYPEYADLDMKNPEDVAKLHAIIKGKGLFPKKMSMLMKKTESGMLPNLLIDKTMKDVDDFYEFLPTLLRAGYKPENIHLIWILTDYRMALVQNRKRARTVPDKILIKTHKGAARTMRDYFIRNYPSDINGEFYVIIGGPQNTVFFSNNKGKALNGSDGLPFAIKDFQYFKLKNAGRSNIDKDSEIARKVYDLVDRYAPDLSEQMIPLSPIAIAPMVGPVLDRYELEDFNFRAKAKEAAVEDRLRNRPIFPPEADTDGDGQLSVYEFVLYVDIMAQELGISDDLKAAVIALLTGRPPGPKGLLALASASNRKKLKKLLKRINKRFNGGRGLGLPFEIPTELPELPSLPNIGNIFKEEKTTPTGVAPYFYVRPDYSDVEIDPELRDFYIRMIAAILERQRKSKFRVVKPTEVAPELDYDPYDPPMGTKPMR